MSCLPARRIDGDNSELAPLERSRLSELERVVEAGLATFVQVGLALSEIRDRCLYRKTHPSFAAYLAERWEPRISRRYAYNLIEAAEVAQLCAAAHIEPPANEAQARELARLLVDEPALLTVWGELRAEHGDDVSARLIRSAVEHVSLAERERVARERSGRERARRQKEESQAPLGEAIFRLGDFRESVGTLEDGSIDLLLTDPPYGLDYRERSLYFAGPSFAGDRSPEEAALLLGEMLVLLRPKLAPDSHVLIFSSWRGEPRTRELLLGQEFALRSSLVWAKDGHGVGDVAHSFGPAHERIVHATRGDARMRFREADVLECPRVRPHLHPTQKPVELLERLIRATTDPGGLVADPFAGVASALVAAVRTGRRAWGCEVDPAFHADGVARLQGEEVEQ